MLSKHKFFYTMTDNALTLEEITIMMTRIDLLLRVAQSHPLKVQIICLFPGEGCETSLWFSKKQVDII